LFEILTADYDGKNDSGLVADEMDVDEAVIMNALPVINEVSQIEIWIEPRMDGYGQYNLWIPEPQRSTARAILARGGWEALSSKRREELVEKKRLDILRQKAEEEKLTLENEALRLQIEDFPKARRERIITRWIAVGAAIISLATFIWQLIGTSATK
jgi:hypothetical protein